MMKENIQAHLFWVEYIDFMCWNPYLSKDLKGNHKSNMKGNFVFVHSYIFIHYHNELCFIICIFNQCSKSIYADIVLLEELAVTTISMEVIILKYSGLILRSDAAVWGNEISYTIM